MEPVVQSTAEYQELLIDNQWQLVRAEGKLFADKKIGHADAGQSLQQALGPFWNRAIKRMCLDAFERGTSSQNVIERIIRGARLIWSFSCAPAVENRHVSGLILKIKDVTKRQRLEAQNELRNKMHMISQMASNVGHKMNNPIAAVLNRIGGILIEDNGSYDAATLRREMQTIQEQLYSISLITNGLAAFSRGNVKEHKLVQMNDVLQNALHLMKLVGGRHKIDFHVDLDNNLPRILGDEVTLEQSIVNICKNAVEALPNGGTVNIKTRVDEQFPDFISISIHDNGQGMSREILEHAFEPFYTTKEPQHGLGLSVCFAVVSSHNGGIELSSQEGLGTTAHIILPIAKLN
jgi:signal transduction histidine kinase